MKTNQPAMAKTLQDAVFSPKLEGTYAMMKHSIYSYKVTRQTDLHCNYYQSVIWLQA